MSTKIRTATGTITLGKGCKHWGKQVSCQFTRKVCKDCPAAGQIAQLRTLAKQVNR